MVHASVKMVMLVLVVMYVLPTINQVLKIHPNVFFVSMEPLVQLIPVFVTQDLQMLDVMYATLPKDIKLLVHNVSYVKMVMYNLMENVNVKIVPISDGAVRR